MLTQDEREELVACAKKKERRMKKENSKKTSVDSTDRDKTHLKTAEGWMYLAIVMDLSRPR